MKGVLLKQEGIGFEMGTVPDPTLQKDDDVLVKVTRAAICGSDLHIKHGLLPGIPPGIVIGHEFVGEIVEAGTAVKSFSTGDRVVAPASVWCGYCPACRKNEIQFCQNGGVWAGGEVFGPGLGGAQTEYVRVPFADVCLEPIPDQVSDDQAILVGDVFSTGYHAARMGNIQTGDTVAVYGCGPIGLAAVVSAWQFGAKKVLAVDALDNRLSLAEHYGAQTVRVADDPVEQIKAATGGQGADVVIEAVGLPDTFLASFKSVRRGGSISVVGLFPTGVEFPLPEAVYQTIRISMGLAYLGHMNQLMSLIKTARVDLSPFITHTYPLDQGMEAYDLFENHKDQCLKVLLDPWGK